MHPIIKSHFAYLESQSTLEGSAFIIEMKAPFLIGSVYSFREDLPFLTKLGQLSMFRAVVPGYRIIIHIVGSLVDGRIMTISQDTVSDIDNLTSEMAQYFLKERVRRLKYYEKFKL